MFSKKISLSLILLFIGTHIGITQQAVKAQTPTPATTTSFCSAQLEASINTVINRPLFSRARWGILIKNLASTQTLYSHDAQKYFTPASNAKLLTTAAALKQLGANFRIRTSIYQDGDGILRVVGRGDPSLKNAQLTVLAKQLRQQGITQINELIADDSYFQGDMIPPSWQWEDVQASYGAPINSLILNENAAVLTAIPQSIGQPLQLKWADPTEAYQWRVVNNSVTTQKDEPGAVRVSRDLKGPVLYIQGQLAVNSQPDITAIAVFDPIQNFLRHFRQSLATESITVKQTSISTNKNEREIAAIESPPLSQLLIDTNLNSNNLFAEALLRSLANNQPLAKNQTTVDVGLKVLQDTLTQLGVDSASYKLVDGSGLSRKNLVSPEALVQVLQAMAASPEAKVFRASLPVAGVSGTLTERFRNTPAEGIVQAKTGTLMGAIALSGYINPSQYEPLAFSIIVNQSEQPASAIRQAIDDVVVLLTQLRRC
ncbi:D-alanyl-D-alanine carboxypeptidase/D-alanyl-D-alanine-endopeptidase [Nostoc sp. FACHB-152]|uniref:D-alanyl-D-alanine carboxypeptidase/D-alanyl-D-alanine endopeptidase n=1 Tax=unclassified Nostoc TaxID=2593658 RepID=UPI001681F0DE|nr:MULTISPECIES: D-alanyl-D-alanine carboxypeptidase/D-alanyl-D-alanine-endopeptidase [unclassified Nostoc]MBD2449369.1 D-alanyl-D-alanine carboxypeptidase/D-alanyl-D-alanine-endopeptidase [Nostoc sp. FACHB-152]MBD2472948.1 D-alanyl-D-alanine carboxypeptidase/D-alanyl-D-alanine-endopeptidase [Nostoc sp. FACHB-145]